jgi:hypothetical protein
MKENGKSSNAGKPKRNESDSGSVSSAYLIYIARMRSHGMRRQQLMGAKSVMKERKWLSKTEESRKYK